MKTLVTTKKYKKFTHQEGSRYELEEYDDDGIHINYSELDIKGFVKWHKVKIADKKQWDELVQKYPRP
jgi:hypothetical protein